MVYCLELHQKIRVRFRTNKMSLSPPSFPIDFNKAILLLQVFFVYTSVVSYVAFVLSLFVPGLSFFWCLGRVVIGVYFLGIFNYIGIKHGFSCINIRQVPWEVLKTEAEGRRFQHLPRDLANVNALKTLFERYYCIKTENICNILRYFLHYFVSPFRGCHANAISTDYARSRAGQYTSRNGSKSVALVRSYWKLCSRALTECNLPF